jgi:hypothetical protein
MCDRHCRNLHDAAQDDARVVLHLFEQTQAGIEVAKAIFNH